MDAVNIAIVLVSVKNQPQEYLTPQPLRAEHVLFSPHGVQTDGQIVGWASGLRENIYRAVSQKV